MEESIQKLAMYLRILYETFKDNYVEMSLAKDATDCAVPYATTLSSILTKKGILSAKHINGHRKNSLSYKWISKTEPNLIMAKAIIDECRSACRSTYYQTHDKCDELTKTKIDDDLFGGPRLTEVERNKLALFDQMVKYPGLDPIEQLCHILGETFYGVSTMMMQNGQSGTIIIKGKLTGIKIREGEVIYSLDTLDTCTGIAKSLSELESKLKIKIPIPGKDFEP